MRVMLARWLCVQHQKLPEWADGTKWPYAVVSDCGIALWHLIVASHCDIALMLTLWLCVQHKKLLELVASHCGIALIFFSPLAVCAAPEAARVGRWDQVALRCGITLWHYTVASHCGITLWHCTDVNPLALCAAQEAAGVGGWDQVA